MNSTTKTSLKEKIITTLKSEGYRVIPSGTTSKSFENIEIFSETFDCYRKFAGIYDGNISYLNQKEFPEAYQKIIEISDNSIHQLLISEYNKNISFKDKYCPKSAVRHSIDGVFLYYNKRTETIYTVPKFIVVTPSSYSTISFSAKMLSKPVQAISHLNKEFYTTCFQEVLEKPLSEYSDDEFTLFEMTSI